MMKILTTKIWLNWAQDYLKGLDNPQLEAEVLLAKILKVDRVWIKMRTFRLSLGQWVRYVWMLRQRKNRVPMAYVLGEKDWAGLKLKVNRSTLIPRDETEELAGLIEADIKRLLISRESADRVNLKSSPSSPLPSGERGSLKILDIGTGSGALAIYLKKAFGKANVWGSDISVGALAMARKNAKNCGIEIGWVQSDLLEKVPSTPLYEGGRVDWDVMVANLPYVPERMIVERGLDFEPSTALYSGADGLNHIRRLAEELRALDINFGNLWLEFLPQQADKIVKIFAPWDVELHNDVSGQPFFAKISRVKNLPRSTPG